MEAQVFSQSGLSDPDRRAAWLSMPLLLSLWVLAGVLMVASLSAVPLERVQEARVLEVGREMLHQGFHGWMIPHANGEIRLHKPPLTYWVSALGYQLFGVNLWAGRVGTAIAGWLTLGLVFWATSWLFDRRAAFFATLALFSSFLFGKFFQLAETDPMSCLFTTAATFFLWRGVEADRRRAEFLWYHAAAAMLGLALMSKGPPVVFPILFFVGYVAARRRWKCLWRFIYSGAPLTFAIFGLPWWVYVYLHRGAERWVTEIEVTADGDGHGAPFYIYIPYLFYGVAPWCAFMVAGVTESFRRVRRDWRHYGLLIWAGGILLPLCVVGNKQFHYLLPLMVPLLMLSGWVIGEVWHRREDRNFIRAIRWILFGTIVVCLFIPAAVILTARENLGVVRGFDWIMAGVLLVMGLAGLAVFFYCKLGRTLVLFAWGACLCMVMLRGWWMPTIDDAGWTTLKTFFQTQVADKPAIFYARSAPANLRYCFALQRVIPMARTPEALRDYLERFPDTLVILPEMSRDRGMSPTSFLVEKQVVSTHKEMVGLFEYRP